MIIFMLNYAARQKKGASVCWPGTLRSQTYTQVNMQYLLHADILYQYL